MMVAEEKKWKIGIVEDDPQFLADLKDLLKPIPEVLKVNSWGSAEEFWRYRMIENLDLILMDIRLPGWDGKRLTNELHAKFPDLPIVMLTTLSDDETVFECLKAGAVGYLLKLDLERIPTLLADVMQGGAAISPEIAVKVIGHFRKPSRTERKIALTDQEEKVLKLVTLGSSRKDIAGELHLSVNTVKFHVRNVYKKLNVNNRAALTNVAYKEGFISGEQGV